MQATLRTRWPRRTPARPRKRASSPGRTGSARGRCTPRSHRCRRPCAPPGQADSARRTLCPAPRPPAASARGRTRRVPPARARGAARPCRARGAARPCRARGAARPCRARGAARPCRARGAARARRRSSTLSSEGRSSTSSSEGRSSTSSSEGRSSTSSSEGRSSTSSEGRSSISSSENRTLSQFRARSVTRPSKQPGSPARLAVRLGTPTSSRHPRAAPAGRPASGIADGRRSKGKGTSDPMSTTGRAATSRSARNRIGGIPTPPPRSKRRGRSGVGEKPLPIGPSTLRRSPRSHRARRPVPAPTSLNRSSNHPSAGSVRMTDIGRRIARGGPQRRCTNAPGSARAATTGERILRTCCPAAWWSFASTSASSRKIVPRCARLTGESRETPPRPRGSG